ncbi:MAG: four helix bundle protein [Candidatus Saccharibacteria bacterium]|nr:four helix bundle protein [Candidatus Saccharibacteria bacterium]
MNEVDKIYDLEVRCSNFGALTIRFCKKLTYDTVSKPLISQLVRSATSVGANYMEANAASSKKDFRNKIYICKKEAQETRHWLKMIYAHEPNTRSDILDLNQEVHELILIFGKILSAISTEARI